MPTQTLPSDSARSRRRLFLGLIVLVWALVYVTSLFQPPLLDDADTVHAEAAREMVQTNDWVTLHINNGFRYLEKAPLIYWATAVSFKLFGVHEWSARLPVALGVLALLLVVYRLGRRVYGEEGGLYSALVLATGFGPFIFTRIMIPDMLVGLWLALGFDFFLSTLDQEKPSRWLCWGIAATMALNLLTKGLIGLVFPIGTIFVFLLLTGNLRHLLKLRMVSNFLVFLLIAAPWHLMASFRNPAPTQLLEPSRLEAGVQTQLYTKMLPTTSGWAQEPPQQQQQRPQSIFEKTKAAFGIRPGETVRSYFSPLTPLPVAADQVKIVGQTRVAHANNRGFFWFYFVNEQVLRYLKKRLPYDYDTVPLWLFWGLLLIWLLPWTAFVPQALCQIPIRIRSQMTQQQRATLLFALWAVIILFFFSFSSRQEYYVIPGVPGLALLLGGWLARETTSPLESRGRRAGRISSLILVMVGVAACAVAVTLAVQSYTPPANYDIAELLKKNPQDYALSFGHFLDLTPQAMGAFRVPLLVTGIVFALGTVLNWLLRRSNRTLPANLVLAAMMVVLLHEAQNGLEIFSPVLSSRRLADAIETNWRPGDLIEANGDYEAASTITFYTHKQIRLLNGRDSNIWYGSFFPDAPDIFDDDQSFDRRWRGGQRIFLWTEEDTVPNYIKNTGYCPLAKWGGKLVLTNERTLCPAQRP